MPMLSSRPPRPRRLAKSVPPLPRRRQRCSKRWGTPIAKCGLMPAKRLISFRARVPGRLVLDDLLLILVGVRMEPLLEPPNADEDDNRQYRAQRGQPDPAHAGANPDRGGEPDPGGRGH